MSDHPARPRPVIDSSRGPGVSSPDLLPRPDRGAPLSCSRPSCIPRRGWLARCLGVLAWFASVTPGLAASKDVFRKLKQPVAVPKGSLEREWTPVPFTARATKPHPGPDGISDILLRGILVRVSGPEPDGAPDDKGIRALCLHCPHELCYVNLVEETEAVRVPEGAKPDNPLLVCPCHFSVFDPASDGALLTGPAGRGLYRFQFEVSENTIEIQGVEEAALG